MAVSDVLKNFRTGGYAGKKDDDSVPEKGETSSRVLKLSEEESKELQGYQQAPGQEQVCEVTGRLEPDGHLHVISVHAPGAAGKEMDGMAEKVAGSSSGGPPMMNMQTQPSPS